MSRVGKKPIQIPEKTEVVYQDHMIKVKGPKGQLESKIHPSVDINIDGKELSVILVTEDKNSNAFHGMTRAIISNMVNGVSTGFDRILEVNGIGYRVEVKGSTLVLSVGYSKPVEFALPAGISAEVEKNRIKLSGIDKQQLGQTASEIRGIRPPEPYKGKGIKYVEETIQRKAGKTAA
ncbi:MAG: 50S ribosomal protein L6 [Proteobacteria bacterium]|nr:50S ribosomal protein L6 [Pseudomonadota bacterium]